MNVSNYSLLERFKLSQLISDGMDQSFERSREGMIDAGLKALLKHPNEWLLLYFLCDQYQGAGNYAEALSFSKKCVQVKPSDIRSTYAHATSYNLLTRAQWIDLDQNEISKIYSLFTEDFKNLAGVFDPKLAQSAIDKTGLTIESAASQAIRWFERSLLLGPDPASRKQIAYDLEVLFERFPLLRI